MNRRQFFTTASAAALTLKASPASPAPPAKPRPTLMKLGCQSAPTTDAHLKYLARYGVNHICGYPQVTQGYLPTLEDLEKMRDLATANKIEIVCVGPPILESSYINKEKHPAIMLAQSPERDRDIEGIQNMIRNCARAGHHHRNPRRRTRHPAPDRSPAHRPGHQRRRSARRRHPPAPHRPHRPHPPRPRLRSHDPPQASPPVLEN